MGPISQSSCFSHIHTSSGGVCADIHQEMPGMRGKERQTPNTSTGIRLRLPQGPWKPRPQTLRRAAPGLLAWAQPSQHVPLCHLWLAPVTQGAPSPSSQEVSRKPRPGLQPRFSLTSCTSGCDSHHWISAQGLTS